MELDQTNIIYTKNDFHLGDNIFCCILFYNIKDYLEQNNIHIYHYCLPEHIDQVKDFSNSGNIFFLKLTETPVDKIVYNLWMGSTDWEYNIYNSNGDYYDVFLCQFFNQFLNKLNIPINLKHLIYEDTDLIVRHETINNLTNDKYKNIDILIINGAPQSNQLAYDVDEWNNIILQFNKKYNVVTTQKVDVVKCTRDDNLTAKDIAAISIYAKKIIAIDSGVSIGLYNKYTIDNVEVIYYVCDINRYNCKCSFPNFIHKNNISDLLFLLNDSVTEPMTPYYDQTYNYILHQLSFFIREPTKWAGLSETGPLLCVFEMCKGVIVIITLLLLLYLCVYMRIFKKIKKYIHI